jgi:RNA recognition motif-containing protein
MPPKQANVVRNFFLGNVAYKSTESELLEFLREQTGIDFSEVKICLNKETQQPRGFGFVTIGCCT